MFNTSKQNNFFMKPRKNLFIVIILLLLSCNILKAQKTMNKLNDKQSYIITLAALEAKGDLVNLEKYLNEALERSLTINECKELFSHLYAYTGFPKSLNALNTLQKVIKEGEQKGKSFTMGKERKPFDKNFDALKEGTKVQAQLGGGKPFSYEFCPIEDYYLKAHLFGDIFYSDVLSFAERELATISALSSIEGLAPQLTSHISGARNMGVKDEELKSINIVLKENVGDIEAYRNKKATAVVFNEKFDEGRPIENLAFPIGELNTAYAKYFIGNSYLTAYTTDGVHTSNVTFEPKCRNNWHIHHKTGQILICVAGEGWYQEWGKEPRKLKAGDVVNIPAEVKHWHGATKDSWFQHIAQSVPMEGATTEWLEAVEDAWYNNLKE